MRRGAGPYKAAGFDDNTCGTIIQTIIALQVFFIYPENA